MEKQIKEQITAATEMYLADSGLSGKELARRGGFSEVYLSSVRNGKYEVGKTTISEAFFRKLATAINYSLKATHWHHVNTPQYIQVINTLEDAREHVEARMIEGETGYGKTYAVDRFCAQNPKGVYRITVNDDDKLPDIIKKITDSIGGKFMADHTQRLDRIGRALKERADAGARPILIIDEAENTKSTGLRAYKALYDMLKDRVAFVLVCTPELWSKLERLRGRKQDGMTQFMRRFRANRVYLTSIDKRYTDFLDGVTDPELRALLPRIANNYGELHDYLKRAIREAAEDGEPLTAEYFKDMYNLT